MEVSFYRLAGRLAKTASQVPAVDGDRGAVDVAGLLRGEEADQVGYLDGLTNSMGTPPSRWLRRRPGDATRSSTSRSARCSPRSRRWPAGVDVIPHSFQSL